MEVPETLTTIYRTASDRDLTFLAAGFAYYAFVSLIPLILLALVVGSLVGGEQAAQRLITVAGDFLPASGGELGHRGAHDRIRACGGNHRRARRRHVGCAQRFSAG